MTRAWSSLAALAAVAFAPCAAAQNVAKVGDRITYTFQQPMANGQGVKSFADLQGKPVLVEFWGTR
jgi:hypothetical protein